MDKKNISEAQLDYNYLSSPLEIEKKLDIIGNNNYQPIDHSKLFLNISDFTNMDSKVSKLKITDEKKIKKKKNPNQTSFYFEDYLETNKKNKILKTLNSFKDRIYLLFFFLFFR